MPFILIIFCTFNILKLSGMKPKNNLQKAINLALQNAKSIISNLGILQGISQVTKEYIMFLESEKIDEANKFALQLFGVYNISFIEKDKSVLIQIVSENGKYLMPANTETIEIMQKQINKAWGQLQKEPPRKIESNKIETLTAEIEKKESTARYLAGKKKGYCWGRKTYADEKRENELTNMRMKLINLKAKEPIKQAIKPEPIKATSIKKEVKKQPKKKQIKAVKRIIRPRINDENVKNTYYLYRGSKFYFNKPIYA